MNKGQRAHSKLDASLLFSSFIPTESKTAGRTMSSESIVELLSETLRIVQQLQSREVGCNPSSSRLLLPLLRSGLDGLGHLTLSSLGLLVDRHLMLELSDVGSLGDQNEVNEEERRVRSGSRRARVEEQMGETYLLLLLVGILSLVLGTKEEVDSGRLDLGVGVVAGESDDGDGFGIVPVRTRRRIPRVVSSSSFLP